jgi:hypothetical protein
MGAANAMGGGFLGQNQAALLAQSALNRFRG